MLFRSLYTICICLSVTCFQSSHFWSLTPKCLVFTPSQVLVALTYWEETIIWKVGSDFMPLLFLSMEPYSFLALVSTQCQWLRTKDHSQLAWKILQFDAQLSHQVHCSCPKKIYDTDSISNIHSPKGIDIFLTLEEWDFSKIIRTHVQIHSNCEVNIYNPIKGMIPFLVIALGK